MKKIISIKPVLTWSPTERKVRLARFIYGDLQRSSGGYSGLKALSVSLLPRLYHYRAESTGWRLTLLGVQVHWKNSGFGRKV